MRVVTFVVFIALLSFTGCAPQEELAVVDLEAERVALREADAAWSQSVNDVERFLSFFAEGAYFLPADMPLAMGEDEIRAAATTLLSTPGLDLTWKATKAGVAKSADLGYTLGAYMLTQTDAEGNQTSTVGKYVTVWRKQTDGQWKVAADCFNPDGVTPPAILELAHQQ